MRTSARNQPLRIAIDAQVLPNNGSGGVESVLVGLIHALGQLNDGPEEYVIIAHADNPNWLSPYLGSKQRIVARPSNPVQKPRRLQPFKRMLGPLRTPIGKLWRELLMVPQLPRRSWPDVSVSDGYYESLGCDVIHFPSQRFVLCALPTIYNPHDLQHLHYPQFFEPIAIAWRETIYRAGCHFAHTVVVSSQWIKEDIEQHYRINRDKVQVIPWAPPTQAQSLPSTEQLQVVKARYRLETPFAYYPAVTWEHKNHLRLIEALAHLRDQEGLSLRLVCTGDRYPRHWPHIEEKLQSLNLSGQVQFLGMVPHEHLRAIYRLAQFVVVPTLFEAASAPVFEAWQEDVPVACSTVTSLPQQTADAALLFDPFSIEAIADAMRRMVTDGHLRADLVCKGQRRRQDFSWERTAKAYRAVYRRAAHFPLTDEDRYLLNWDWMRDSKPLKKEIV